jgi:hypothetical protein
MGMLQDMLESRVREQFALHKVGTRLIENKLQEKGVRLTEDQLAALESKLENVECDSLTIQIDEAQLPALEWKSQEDVKSFLDIDLSDSQADIEELLEEFGRALSQAIPEAADEVGQLVLRQLDEDAPSMLRQREKEIRSFEARLAERWRRPLDSLTMFLVLAMEAGYTFNRECRQRAAAENDCVFEVLTRLHARACQIASEVLVLLKAGHADGAHARWRSLHEVAVVGFFVASAGNDVAERYLLHDAVDSYKAAKAHQRHCKALGVEPLSEQELRDIKSAYDQLVARFGPSYKEQYGWAAPAIGPKRPTFSAVEDAAGLGHLRPFYNMACHNVHADSKSLFFRLGLHRQDHDALLAGPSNTGLADPGHATAISLGQITTALLCTKPDMDRLVTCSVLMRLAREVGGQFLAVQEALESESAT